MHVSYPSLPEGTGEEVASSPQAIQACIASLAAEAFELGHTRAAQVLSLAAALLAQAEVWEKTGKREG
ncbi:hypothetical protein EOD42_15870 [Rhodovarius crocodyli]|uniref:Uncharacterized protein n=1 Tax=Rhodovarius crocodyli TaxID=1979269 RepID=A0A437MDD3_9PROT|nr:hypothetical protein [Rhodovarius crocodyli]RVT95674.1 hypothetical protein EOD42_15870 [Rhodovarius crocodyli]